MKSESEVMNDLKLYEKYISQYSNYKLNQNLYNIIRNISRDQ